MSRWLVVGVVLGWIAGPLPAQPDAVDLTARINQHLETVWQARAIRPADPASDADFLRRVSLDLTGCIPAAAEVRAFLADTRPDRRERVVDRLLNSPGYVQHQAHLWREELLPSGNGPQVLPWRVELEAWLQQRLLQRVNYDRFAREILSVSLTFDPASSRGSVTPRPFYKNSELKPENMASAVSRVFLGIQLDCAQCHDHPFEAWTQKQFAEFAAFFAGAKATRTQAGRVAAAVEDPTVRSFALPDQKPVSPRFLDGTAPQWKEGLTPREALADWVVSGSNAHFTRQAVNRVWARFFGAPLAQAGDENFDGLMKVLCDDFVAHGYDERRLARAIVLSRPYRAASTGQAPTYLFARMRTRGLSAEQMQASLARATGLPDLALVSLRTDFLGRFQQVGEKPADRHISVLQVLTLMNGELIDAVLQGPAVSAIREVPWLDGRGKVEELFLATLSRLPTAKERERFEAHLARAGDAAFADVLWALLNSGEFLLNR